MQGMESFGWRGDHTFNSGAADYSLEHFLEPEIQKNNPSWSSNQVRTEAARRMEFRLAQDKLFTSKETNRDREMTTRWEIQDIDGRPQLVTQYGDSHISLETLWRHTEEYAQRVGVPEVFNREEMKMQLAIQDALISKKANGAAVALSHPDSIRYVQTWVAGADGTFYSKQIDIGASAGRDFKHSEVDGFMGKIRDRFAKQTVVLDGIGQNSYVAVRGVIDEITVTRTARSFVESRQLVPHDRLIEPRHQLPVMAVLHESRLAPYERTYEVYPIKPQPVDYLRAIRDPRFIDEPRPIVRDRQTNNDRVDAIIPPKEEHRVRSEQTTQTQQSPEKSQELPVAKTLVNIHKEKTNTVRQLAIVEKTGVSVGAIPILLEKLVSEPPQQVKTLEKSIRRNKKKKEKLAKATHQKETVSIKRVSKQREVYVRTVKESQRRPISLGKEKRATKRKRTRVRTVEKSPERSVSLQKKHRLIKETPRRKRKRNRIFSEKKLYKETLKKRSVTKEKKKQRQKEVPFKLTKKEKQRVARTMRVMIRLLKKVSSAPVRESWSVQIKERQHKIQTVARFSLAWALLLILPRKEKKINQTRVFKRQRERPYIPQKEPSHWVLLSIIWYLGILRESARGGSGFTRGAARNLPKLPHNGVIFVANPD